MRSRFSPGYEPVSVPAQRKRPGGQRASEDLLRLLGRLAPVAGGVAGGIGGALLGGPAGAGIGMGIGGAAGQGVGALADYGADEMGRPYDEAEMKRQAKLQAARQMLERMR